MEELVINNSNKETNEYEVRFLAVWPCLLEVDAIEIVQKIGKEKWETKIHFNSKKKLEIPSGDPEFQGYTFTNSAFIEITSKLLFKGTTDELFNHYVIQIKNSQKLISTYMEVINTFIMRLKYSFSNQLSYLVRLRNIGILDLTLHNLIINNQGIYMRTNQLISNFDKLSNDKIKKSDLLLENKVKREWILLTRAADLINIGFIDEGLIVCFALLDYEVQNFVRKNLNFLNSEEIELVLRGIDKKRLQIYLGPLMKILKSESPLDDFNINSDLKWLNNKRNDIMHNGASCTSAEAERALNIVTTILTKLNDLGNDLELPKSKIIF
jgi:hypothetical protein